MLFFLGEESHFSAKFIFFSLKWSKAFCFWNISVKKKSFFGAKIVHCFLFCFLFFFWLHISKTFSSILHLVYSNQICRMSSLCDKKHFCLLIIYWANLFWNKKMLASVLCKLYANARSEHKVAMNQNKRRKFSLRLFILFSFKW